MVGKIVCDCNCGHNVKVVYVSDHVVTTTATISAVLKRNFLQYIKDDDHDRIFKHCLLNCRDLDKTVMEM